jgi:hypothetical protein
MTGRAVWIWARLSQVHVLLDGHRIKALPLRLGDHVISAGLPLAGQRVTLRPGGPVAHVLSSGVMICTVACPVPPEARSRLHGARPGTAQPPRPPELLVVTRRVPVRGPVMVGGQKVQVGLAHARKTAEVTVGTGAYELTVEPASPSPRPVPPAATSDGTRHPSATTRRAPEDSLTVRARGLPTVKIGR